MTAEQIIGLVLALFVMVLGAVASVVPGLPGSPVVLLAAIGHKLYFRQASAGWLALTVMGLIMALALVMDYLATIYGAKKLGATKKGMFGAMLGGIIGLFFSLPGILIGPFIGAALLEMMGGREFKPALKAGLGATLGLFAGAFGKIICCGAMILLFAMVVVWHAYYG